MITEINETWLKLLNSSIPSLHSKSWTLLNKIGLERKVISSASFLIKACCNFNKYFPFWVLTALHLFMNIVLKLWNILQTLIKSRWLSFKYVCLLVSDHQKLYLMEFRMKVCRVDCFRLVGFFGCGVCCCCFKPNESTIKRDPTLICLFVCFFIICHPVLEEEILQTDPELGKGRRQQMCCTEGKHKRQNIVSPRSLCAQSCNFFESRSSHPAHSSATESRTLLPRSRNW